MPKYTNRSQTLHNPHHRHGNELALTCSIKKSRGATMKLDEKIGRERIKDGVGEKTEKAKER
eukprot:scaffold74053_cov63-Cyclotella_meneghiniana.AAC.2